MTYLYMPFEDKDQFSDFIKRVLYTGSTRWSSVPLYRISTNRSLTDKQVADQPHSLSTHNPFRILYSWQPWGYVWSVSLSQPLPVSLPGLIYIKGLCIDSFKPHLRAFPSQRGLFCKWCSMACVKSAFGTLELLSSRCQWRFTAWLSSLPFLEVVKDPNHALVWHDFKHTMQSTIISEMGILVHSILFTHSETLQLWEPNLFILSCA